MAKAVPVRLRPSAPIFYKLLIFNTYFSLDIGCVYALIKLFFHFFVVISLYYGVIYIHIKENIIMLNNFFLISNLNNISYCLFINNKSIKYYVK